MAYNLKPCAKYIAVAPWEPPQVTSGGLHLTPEMSEVNDGNRQRLGQVIAVGPEVTACKPGDHIIMSSMMAVFPDGVHGEVALFTEERHICAIVERTGNPPEPSKIIAPEPRLVVAG